MNKTLVVTYHNIVKNKKSRTDRVSHQFINDIEFILSRNIKILSLDELHYKYTSTCFDETNSIVITFDDNYIGFYDYAYPILDKYKIPCSIFVHTGFVGNKIGYEKMSWSTLAELVENPIVTIGSHTVNHHALSGLPKKEQMLELKNSKEDLEAKLNKKINYLSYPYGKYNSDTIRAAKYVDYLMSFTIEKISVGESKSIYEIGRFEPQDIKKFFLKKIYS